MSDEAETTAKEIRWLWEVTPNVMDDDRAKKMQAFLDEADDWLAKDEPRKARTTYYHAKREYTLARKDKQLYYSRSWRGMLFALVILLLLSVALGCVFGLRHQLPVDRLLVPMAGVGGAVGGCTAVLLQAINVDPNSEAVSKFPWYVIKPSLGGALGMVTYVALQLGIQVLTNEGVTGLEAATVVGFLAGFFESFSTGVLSRIAGKYTDP